MATPTPQTLYATLRERLHAGDIDGLMQLYEPEAVLVAQPGQCMAGSEQVRAALLGFLALKPRFDYSIHEVIEAGDVALVSASWTLTGTGPDGSAVDFAAVTADVLRRQADGAWRYVVDQPWGDTMTAA